MKAPTADYSPLAQALSSRNSALQASYSAKNASNWKSSYDIQQQSFDLQEDSLDLQQESIDLSRLQTNVSGALSVFNTAVDFADKLIQTKQASMEQRGQADATALASEIQSILDSNPDLTSTWEDEDGITHVGLTEKGEQTVRKYIDEVFPEGKKYGWGMDETMKLLKESVYNSAASYSRTLAVSRTQGEMETAFNKNLEAALEDDLNSGETVIRMISDGTGGTREQELGARQAAVIDSLSIMGTTWQENQYAENGEKLLSERGNRILTQATTNYTDGTFILDATAREEFDATVAAQLEKIPNLSDRADYEKKVKEAVNTGAVTYFTDQTSAIMAQPKDSYSDLSKLYDSITDGGELVSAFSGKYMEPSTITTVRSLISEQMTTCETLAGQTDPNAILNGFKKYNTQFEAGQINATAWGSNIDAQMKLAYGENWRNNDEALNVYMEQMKTLMPEELTSDPTFMNYYNIAWQTALDKSGVDFDKLTEEEKVQAEMIKKDMMQEFTTYLLQNPSAVRDPLQYANGLKQISSKYSLEWANYIETTVNEVTLWDTLNDGEVKNKVKKQLDYFVDTYSADFTDNISEAGYLDRSAMSFDMGVNEATTDAITQLGHRLIKADGVPIADPAGGSICFKLNDDGSVYYNSNGKPEIDSIRWTSTSGGQVVYDYDSKKYIEPTTISTTTTDPSGKTTTTPTELVSLDDVNSFIETPNSATEGGLEKFLWGTQSNEALDNVLDKLTQRHKAGKYAPGMSDGDLQAMFDSVAERVRENKGWETGESETVEEPAAVEKTVSTIVEANPDGNVSSLVKTLEESCSTEEQLNETITELQQAHVEGSFMNGAPESGVNKVLDMAAEIVSQDKGWNVKGNQEVSDGGTGGNKPVTTTKAEEEVEEVEESSSVAAVTEFISKKGERPSLRDIQDLFNASDDVDSVLEELLTRAENGEIIIPKVPRRTDREALTNIANFVKKNRKDK